MKFENVINKIYLLENEYNDIESKLNNIYNKLNVFKDIDIKSLSKTEQMDWVTLRNAKSTYENKKENIEKEMGKLEKLKDKKLSE